MVRLTLKTKEWKAGERMITSGFAVDEKSEAELANWLAERIALEHPEAAIISVKLDVLCEVWKLQAKEA